MNLKIKVSLFVNYFLFAILLNSVGTVILQTQRYFGVLESDAAILEGFKDLSIAVVSFIIASFITRLGYKKSMLLALAMVGIACFSIPFIKGFLAIKLLFAIVGAGFAFTKISVFGIIGLVTKSDKEHVSLMNFIESFFTVGVFAGYYLFAFFINNKDAASARWFDVYFVLGGLAVLAFLLLLASPLDESEAHIKDSSFVNELRGMLALIILPIVIASIVCTFLYVLIEQSIMSWLPTFNSKVLSLPSTYSLALASILSASFALGRFTSGFILRKFSWLPVLLCCLAGSALLVLIALPLAKNETGSAITAWKDVPVAAFVFPLIGFLLGPIYPAVNSLILSSLPKTKHGTMAGLIVVFSALGGTLGSIITGNIFQRFGGQTAFYFSLAPITLLVIVLVVLYKIRRANKMNKSDFPFEKKA